MLKAYQQITILCVLFFLQTEIPEVTIKMSNAIRSSNARILNSFKSPPNVVVAGGTGGIGRAIAIAIAQHCPSANITIIGRNEAAANEILPKLSSKSRFLRADVSLMKEIRAVTKKITAVDILVLTQGVFTFAGFTPTAENIDNKLALHYYGRMLFVQELLPLLRLSSGGGRVLSVLDAVNGNPAKINWDDMALENSYSLSSAANHAITFNDLIIQHFASQPENANVSFTHALPGTVRTGLADNLPFYTRIPLKGLMFVFMKLGFGTTAENCAEYMLHGMLGTEKGWRCVDSNGEIVKKKKPATDEQIQKVWEHTSKILSPN